MTEPKQKLMTPSERRAFRWGYMRGFEDAARQLELFRIRVGARGVVIDVPTHWQRLETEKRESA